VFFGVGSMRSGRLADLMRMAVEAIQATGHRGILGVPRAEGLHPPPDRFFVVEGIPHSWLFPRVRFAIHHGGAGTTGAVLRAGVPSVATPFTADQAFWGRRIHRLGVGPEPLPAKRISSRRLASLIDQAVNDTQMQHRASELGRGLSGEDGVAAAIRIIYEAVDDADVG
jgi:UDP:flavonoid glycosyltransferase YjiC (YdhE family)